MQYISQTLTTDGSGDATVTVRLNPGSNFVRKVQYVKTDFADGVDLAITDGIGGEVLTVSSMNAAAVYAPKMAANLNTTGAALLYAAGGTAVTTDVPVVGSLTITIAQGGDTKTGEIRIWVA